jgi:hypothetical protein
MIFQAKEHSVPSISTSEQGEDERGEVPVTSAGILILDTSVRRSCCNICNKVPVVEEMNDNICPVKRRKILWASLEPIEEETKKNYESSNSCGNIGQEL